MYKKLNNGKRSIENPSPALQTDTQTVIWKLKPIINEQKNQLEKGECCIIISAQHPRNGRQRITTNMIGETDC